MKDSQRKEMFAKEKTPQMITLQNGRKVTLKQYQQMDYAQMHEGERRCDIVRFFREDGKHSRIIKRNISESVAKLHCNDPRTRKEGVWFDGFRYRD